MSAAQAVASSPCAASQASSIASATLYSALRAAIVVLVVVLRDAVIIVVIGPTPSRSFAGSPPDPRGSSLYKPHAGVPVIRHREVPKHSVE